MNEIISAVISTIILLTFWLDETQIEVERYEQTEIDR